MKLIFELNVSDNINEIQLKSLRQQIERAKIAHYIDIVFRINGESETHEADWIKYLKEITA